MPSETGHTLKSLKSFQVDIEAVGKHIHAFLKKHSQALYKLSTNQSKTLELAVTVAVSEHYTSHGYSVSVNNPLSKPNRFVIKTSTRGYPWNFSVLHLERDGVEFEAHMNLLVRSAHDEGRYCVDLGVVNQGVVPNAKPKVTWDCVPNDQLVTFAEVKKLVVYPMLLAQFLGIVHEIKPTFIGGHMPYGFLKRDHLLPTLASLGGFSGNSSKIVGAYESRKVRVNIAENFDVRLARVRFGDTNSPFEALK